MRLAGLATSVVLVLGLGSCQPAAEDHCGDLNGDPQTPLMREELVNAMMDLKGAIEDLDKYGIDDAISERLDLARDRLDVGLRGNHEDRVVLGDRALDELFEHDDLIQDAAEQANADEQFEELQSAEDDLAAALEPFWIGCG